MRRTITGGVAAFAAASIALAGCSSGGSDTGAPKTSPSPQKQDISTLLPQSLKKIESESFRFTSTVTMAELTITAEGAFDMAKKAGQVTMDMAGQKMKMRILGTDMYMSDVTEEGSWIHLDLEKLPAGNTLSDMANPVANADYLLAISDDVKEVGDGKYQGTLDLKKYLEEHADPKEVKELEEALGELGSEAMNVPFEATVDDEGRLTAMKITMTLAVEGEKTEITQEAKYFDFGATVDVTKPPADKVKEAPSGMYER